MWAKAATLLPWLRKPCIVVNKSTVPVGSAERVEQRIRSGLQQRDLRQPGGRAALLHALAHIEFTKDGRYALASVWEMDGALIVYDAATFKEVKRLPMSKPVGKYNVWNKITRSEGTSH